MPQKQAQPGIEVVIAGFGLPGRFVAELLDYRGIQYSVIELNPKMAERLAGNGRKVISGDIRDEKALREAGIEQAKFLVVTIPDERAIFDAIKLARKIRPDIRIIARFAYTSGGLHAQTLGASEVVVAEQLVAREFFRLLETHL